MLTVRYRKERNRSSKELPNNSETSWSTKVTKAQISQTENKTCFFVLVKTRTFFQFRQSLRFAPTQHPCSDHLRDLQMTARVSAHFEVTLIIPALRRETLSQRRAEHQYFFATGVKDGSLRARLQVSRRKWESFQGLPRTFGQALACSRTAFPPRS